MIHKTRDASFKTIFANNELFAEFLRDFVSIEVFREVRPRDIKDESAHFRPRPALRSLPLTPRPRATHPTPHSLLPNLVIFVHS
jgi:hypothetical protein